MGMLIKRGWVWWTKLYDNGRPLRESTGIVSDGEVPPQEARRVLKQREGRVAAGLTTVPRVGSIRYEELPQDLRQHCAMSGARDLKEAEFRLAHLGRLFAGRKAAAITGSEITTYTVQRQREGAANASVNRELATLSRMLRLAYENQKLLRLPVMRRLKEADPRAGFFDVAQFEAVRRHLPIDLQVAVTLAYTYGWRVRSEILTLERRQVDLEAGTIRLDPGMTKNDDGRVVYLTPELKALLADQLERVETLQRRTERIIPYLFPHLRGKRAGTRRRDFRKAWKTACNRAGVPGRIRHDFRRTAVRNMVNAGVAERVAMTVTGHKTRAVFDRYHIVSPADLQDVARRLALQAESATDLDAARGHVFGHVGSLGVDPRRVTSENPSTRL
jgi:integrase